MNNPYKNYVILGVTLLLASCGGEDNESQDTSPSTPPLVSTNPEQACLSVAASFNVASTTVDPGEHVAAGFVPPGSRNAIDKAFCRLQMASRPAAGSDIKSEIWMPSLDDWNHRFLAVGGGGNSGSIQYAAMSSGFLKGYAVLSTDN